MSGKGGNALGSKKTPRQAASTVSEPLIPKEFKLQKSARAQIVSGFALLCIGALAFATRLFSVIKYESVIHEFDPYFNYRVTQHLTTNGFYSLWNWFDDATWYPLGRVVGGTVYPGLIYTAGIIHNLLHFFNIPIHVQEICVFTAPLFSSLCAWATYAFVNEIRGQGAGLTAAVFMSIIPSYMSRSVAGSYDNEGVAIFALVLVFYLYVKTLNTGSLAWGTASALAYFYMVMSWGGYSFIINLLPIHCLTCIVTGRLSSKLYVAYAPFIILGTIEAASIPVVGFNAVLMSEHFASFLVFGILHGALAIRYIKEILPEREYQAGKTLVISVGTLSLLAILTILIGYAMASPTFGWTGRSLSLLDPTYASKYIPIIASVSEHQPPAWPSYFTDLHMAAVLMPAGLLACFLPLTDASLFLVLYGVTAVYFSGVMVRLMLVLAPAACCLAGIAVHGALSAFAAGLRQPQEPDAQPADSISPVTSGRRRGATLQPDKKSGIEKGKRARQLPRDVAAVGICGLSVVLIIYTFHCIWVAAEMYSAPSIVLQNRQPNGVIKVFDDFRESYAWLRYNTEPDDKVASWWDYGYQTTAMANRTVIVDNNTWNNTHIATVGRAMASPERKAWKIYRDLDVKYVFVVFGGYIGYPSDDINKFLWMVRIGGGVFPEIKEKDYLGNGNYRVDAEAGKGLLNSLMYKLCYYRFPEAAALAVGRYGFDRVRQTVIGDTNIKLKYFEEVFTTEHWMVRIYRVRERPLRESKLKNPRRVKGSSRSRSSKQKLPSGAPL